MEEHMSWKKHAWKAKLKSKMNGSARTGKDFSSSSAVRAQFSKAPPGVCFVWFENGTCYKGSKCTYKHYLPVSNNIIEGDNDNDVIDDDLLTCQPATLNSSFQCNVVSPSLTNHKMSKQKRFIDQIDDDRKSNDNPTISTEIMLSKHKLTKEKEVKSNQKATKSKLAPIFCKPVTTKKNSGDDKNDKKMSKFPEEYRNLFHRKRDVNLYIKDGKVVWQFAYNAQVIRAIKEHIKGRAWNPNIGVKGCWTSPLEGLPDAIALYEHMGRTPSDDVLRRAKEVEEALGPSSSDAIKLLIRVDLQNLLGKDEQSSEDEELSIGSIDVTFLYDAAVVSSLKMLPPTQRSYEPSSKTWSIDLFALAEMLNHLTLLGYKPNDRLKDIARVANDIENAIFRPYTNQEDEILTSDTNGVIEIPDSDDENEMNATSGQGNDGTAKKLEDLLKKLVSLVAENDSVARKINFSDCGKAKKRRLTLAQMEWSFKQDLLANDNDSGLRRKLTKSKHIMSIEKHDPNCDCGQPWKKQGGVHTCRYFGHFDCGNCGNQWTSAYCWKGETQACRDCDTESLPWKKDRLDGGKGLGSQGAHDFLRCGMCQKLGYNCNLS